MKPITVSSEKSYEVIFTDDAFKEASLIAGDKKVVIVAPKSLVASFGSSFPSKYLLIEVEDGEEQKSITQQWKRNHRELNSNRYNRSG